jgi:hypothetical protein
MKLAPFLLTSNAFCADANQVTLDQILAEIRALNEKSLLFKAASPITRSTPKSPPKGSKDKCFENLRIELRKADVRASGAWTVPETWDRVALK